MPRKKKRSITDELLGGSLFNDTELTSDKLSETGYSISVVQTPEGAKVKAKVGKDTDVNAFRKQLQQKYARMPLGGPRPPSSKEECSLCGRVVPYYSLRRCFRCNRLFCKSCITEDLVERRYLVCLNCARRYVSPHGGFRGKYTALTFYLSRKAQWTRWVKLQFSQIEGIIGNNLPVSAIQNTGWWNNTKSSSQGKAWLNVGWKVKEVNLKEGTVIFTLPDVLKPEKKRRRKRLSPKVVLPEYKPRKVKTPSLSRIAKAQARLQNVARQKASMRRYRGKFKPKSAHEKRLYKPDEKP